MNQPINRIEEKVLRFIGLFHIAGYVLLITPPRAIDLTIAQRSQQGELARQPLFVVMLVELLIRIALILLLAVGLESMVGDSVYETYRFDVLFSIIVLLGVCHSLFYFMLLGYLSESIGLRLAMRIYRLLRNLCYAAIPGFFTVIPLLLWHWKRGQLPFADGLVLTVYLATTMLMIVFGVVEAMLMKRKPLGLDRHLHEE